MENWTNFSNMEYDGIGKTQCSTEAYHSNSKYCVLQVQSHLDVQMKMSYYRMMKYEQCFSPVSLCEVAGLAETFPSFPVSGPFLTDASVFQVPPDNIFPPQLQPSYRALPLHLHFDTWVDVFCLISSFDVPNHSNHRYRFHLCYLKISSFLRCSYRLPPLPIAPFSSLLLPYVFHH